LSSGGNQTLVSCVASQNIVFNERGSRRLISEFHIELHMYSYFTACRYKSNSVRNLYRIFAFKTFFLQVVVSKVEINLLLCTPHRRVSVSVELYHIKLSNQIKTDIYYSGSNLCTEGCLF